MQLDHSYPSRLCRLTFTLLMAWIWAGGVKHAYAADPPPNTKANTERLERAFKALEATAKDTPRDTFDIGVVAKAQDNDPAKLLAWVKDQTVWVPYRGALRGPIGTLMDRRGNSLDRATLTAELLRSAGKTTRLAHAELPEANVADVRKSLTFLPTPAAAALPTGRAVIDDIVTKYAKPFDLDVAAVKRSAEDMVTRSERLTEELVGRSVEQSAMLSKLVWPAANSAPAADDAALVAALRDHWWAQYKDGDNWVDADPLLATPLKPAETIDWQPKNGVSPLDAKNCQEVEIRVVVEQWLAGKLLEHVVLKHTLRPMDVIGEYIELNHVPQGWPADLDLSKEENPGSKVREVALAQNDWMPALRVGKSTFAQGSFNDQGVVNPKPDIMEYKKTAKVMGQAAGKVGDLLDGGPVAEAKPAGMLTAEWIEYEIRIPGKKPQAIRRQLFDLVGPGARVPNAQVIEPVFDEAARSHRGLALIGQTEILPLACQLSPEFVNDLTTHNTLAMRDLIMMTAANSPDADRVILQALPKVAPIPSRLYDLALIRSSANPQRDALYVDRPNILSLHTAFRDDGKAGALYCIGVDVVTNELAARPDIAPAKAREARLMQGVIDTNAETLLMDKTARIANIADRLANQGDPDAWMLVRKADDEAWKQLNTPPELRSRVDADLAQGYAVLVQKVTTDEGEVERGWWRIDPQTGQTLGMSERGWGQSMTEQAVLFEIAFTACMAGAAFSGKLKGGAGKAVALCALGGIGAVAAAPAVITTRIIVGFLAASAAAGAS